MASRSKRPLLRQDVLRGSDFSINASYFQDLFSRKPSFTDICGRIEALRCLRTSC